MPTTSRCRGSLAERLWRNVDRSRPDGCWVWTAAKKDGYGRLTYGGRGTANVRAHRLAYELLVGPIPEGRDLDHICRNRACVNPAHLEPVTRRENTLRSPVAITARKSRQTHCCRGHLLAGENLRVWKGRRYCMACRRSGGRP